MHLKTRNVNSAFRELVRMLASSDPPFPVSKRSSRYGDTLTIEEPVTITYTHPRERVLFNVARDCNVFFHLYESLWMLTGRNDVAPLAYYASRMNEFSDDGKTLNGAYGYRWRHACSMRPGPTSRGPEIVDRYWHVDQLDVIVKHLKATPNSRRAVLALWNVMDDLLKIGPAKDCTCGADRSGPSAEAHDSNCPAREPSRDVACNLAATFQMRTITTGPTDVDPMERTMPVVERSVLDMTVFNRSNDMIWGALGANAVHFSFLQEYLAARIGVGVGVYNQITTNLHVYTKTWEPSKWLEWESGPEGRFFADHYEKRTLGVFPLVKDPTTFEAELPRFVARHASGDTALTEHEPFTEPFFKDVAEPMLQAFHSYKRRGAGTMSWVAQIVPADWRCAAFNWLNDRLARRKEKESKGV